MPSRLAPLVLLTCSLVTRAAAGSSPLLCAWTKVLPNQEVHRSFLRPAPPSARLYHSAWSAGGALLSCAWSDDASVTRDYRSACEERAQDFADHLDPDLHPSPLLEAEGQCVSVGSPGTEELGGRAVKRHVRSAGGPPGNRQGQDGSSEVSTHLRVKRGFIVPGTLWCGSGNKALSNADLGVFADTDSCCREHDQCKHTILSFQSQFGLFNNNIFTMSHCDCDNKFRSCLTQATDRIADVVGYTFFNLLKMHCFDFSYRQQCTQRNWFGMCKETKMAPYAEVHPATVYESTDPSGLSSSSSFADATAPAGPPRSSASDTTTAAASTAPPPSTRPAPAPFTPVTTTVATSAATKASTGSVPERAGNLESTRPVRNQTGTELHTDITGVQLSCGIYRDLDECQYKIPPQQMRYGLHNPEDRTLYHCNCTTRLFQTLIKQRQLTQVQDRLLEHVSRSCFLSQDCTTAEICTANLVTADLPELEQKSSAEVEEQHHLQAVQRNVRRPNTSRAKRKDRALKLYKFCLRIAGPRQMNQKRKRIQNT